MFIDDETKGCMGCVVFSDVSKAQTEDDGPHWTKENMRAAKFMVNLGKVGCLKAVKSLNAQNYSRGMVEEN